MTNNYKSKGRPQRIFAGWLRLMILLLTVGLLSQNGFAQTTTQIGTGVSSTYFYGPVYRSSAASTFNWSRYSYIYTAAELSAAGIPSGAQILGIEWYKNSTFVLSAAGSGSLNIYMKNSATTAYGASGTWSTLITGASLVNTRTFNNSAAYPAIPGNFPSVVGWMNFPISTFAYTGGSLEIMTDWTVTGASPSTGAFNWLHNTNTPNQTLGVGSGTANPVTLTQVSYGGANRPNISIIWSAGAANDVAVQAPAVPVGSLCNGSSTPVSVTFKNNGSSTIDFSVNPATISGSVTGPNPTSFTPVVINSGTLAAGATQVVTLAAGYNAGLFGTYNFSASVSWGPDGFAGNNTTSWSASSAFSVVAAPNVYTFCDGTIPQLTTTAPVGYVATSIPHAPITPVAPAAGPTGDDAVLAGIALPFSFTYNGVAQTTVNIFTNGYIQFGTSSGNTTTYGSVIPNAAAPNNIVALAWEDLNVTTGNIQYFTDGVAPNRKFVVAYNSVFFYSATGNVTGQIVLNESDNSIDMFLTNVNQLGNSSVCGIENATGTAGTVAPGRQFGIWTPDPVVNEGWHFALPTLSYAWTPATGLSNTSISNPTATIPSGTSQTYTVTVTNPLTGCVVSDTVLLTNLGGGDPAPSTVGASVCAGVSATLTASGLSTLRWYTAPIGGTLVNTGPSYTSTFGSTTTFYVESFNGICPSARTPVTITVTPQPVINPQATPNVFCLGSTAQLNANNYVSGNLQTAVLGGNGSSGNAFDISNVNGSSPIRIDSVYMGIASGTLAEVWYKPGGYGCAALSSSAGWTLAGSVAIVAAGGTPNLTSIPLNINVTIPVGQTYGFVVVCNGSNYYTNGSAVCTPLIGDANISISQGHGGAGMGGVWSFPNAPRNFNGKVFYSFGDPNLTFSWAQTVGAGSISNSSIANPTVTPSTSGINTYALTAVNAANCSTTVAVNVTANPIPGDVSAISSTSSFCGCGVAVLDAILPTVGSNVRWYDAATGGNLLGTGTPFNAPFACGPQTYYAEAFDPLTGCVQTGARLSFTFTPLVAPSVSVSATDLNLCNGEPASTITATSPNDPNYVYTWAPATGLTNISNGVVTALPANSTTYTVTGTDGSTGCVNTASITIGVGQTPVIVGATATPSAYCIGGSSQLVALAVPSGGIPAEPVGYCAILTYTSPGVTGDYISNVTFNTLNNTTGDDPLDYTLYPSSGSTTTTVSAGSTYTLSVTTEPTFGQGKAVFIDWNRDAIFDASEMVLVAVSGTTPVSQSVLVPVTASSGQTRMRVVCVYATNGDATFACAPTSFGFGEVEDYTITVQSGGALTYAWSPATGLSSTTIANPVANPTASQTYTVTVSDAGGCSASTVVPVTVVNPPVPPTVVNATRCGQGIVNLSATGSGGSIIWLDTIAGPILNTGNTYSPVVTSSQNYYVIENPGAVPYNVGLSATAVGTTAFASSTANYQTFNVLSPGGLIINTVDIVPNAATPLGTAVAIQLEDAVGNALGAPVSTVTTTQGTVQTITLNMFVPQGTGYRLRPVSNPNLQYHQNGFTNPFTLPGQLSITGWGPPNATTLYVFFYNWNISTFDGASAGCYSGASVATATVTTPPVLAILPGGPTSYCNTGSVTLDAASLSDPSYVNFSWSPATGLDVASGPFVTASPSVTTTYTLTADDGLPNGCANTATVTITVNSGPTVSIVPAPYDSLCSGASFPISATSGSSSFKQIGAGTNSANNTIAVYDGNNTSVKTQILYTAAELNAAGLIGPGNITSIAFNVVNKLSTGVLNGFTINMASVATVPPLTTSYVTGTFTTVFTGNVSTVLGWNQHTFSTAFAWDGVSNVLVEICNGTPSVPGFDQIQNTPTAVAQTIQANLLGCTSLTGNAILNRPNTRFTGGAVTYSWSPAGELSSGTIEDPIFTSTFNGTKNLVLTVTDPANGCTASSTLSFVVSDVPKVASVASISSTDVCVSGTVSARAFGTAASYQWQTSSDNISFTDIPGATDDTLSLFVNVDTYVRAKTICSDSAFSASIFYDVAVPVMASVENDTVCGQGNVSLIGTPGAGFYSVWYTEQTGGLFLQLGDTLNTFVAATDTFWVAASVAPIPAPGPAPTGYPANSATVTGDEDITAVTIGSLVNNQPAPNCALYTDYTALPAPVLVPGSTVPFSISIGDCENSSFFSSGVAMFIDFDRNGSFGDAGEQVYATAVTTNGIYTVSGTFTVPLTASIGFTRARIINAEGFPTPTFNQVYSYGETEDYLVQIGSNVCQSPRVPVIAVVNTAPAFEVTPTAASICEGNSVNIDVTTGLADYTNFSWTPAAGLNTVSGPNVIANPSVNSTYFVTATGNAFGCVNVDTAVITVNPAPIFTVASNLPSVCNGDTVTVTATVISPVATNYVASPIAFAPVSPSGAPTVLVSGGVAVVPQTIASLDDGTWEGLPLPAGFAFNYYGTTPTQFNVSTNGFITFGASLGSAYCCSGQVIPNAATPNDYLAISHEDFLLTASGDIDYFTEGVAPNRKFVVRFTNVPRFGGTGAPTTAQIVLNETSNSIEYHITSVTTASGDATTMGIEDGTGTYATVISGRNSTSPWTATNEGWSFAPPSVANLLWTGQNIIGSNTALAIQANPSSSGYYAVTVTNPATGCFKSDSVLVNASVSPSPVITPGDTALCFPNSIYLHVVDTGAFVGGYPVGTQYNWINITGGFVPDLDSINSLNGSTYQVIVKLPSGCYDSSSVRTVITRAVAVVPTIVNASCAGAGSITATVTSGLPPYNFVWSTDLAQTNIIQNVTQSSNVDVLSNLLAGTYYLSISDSAGSPVSCNSGVLTYTVSGSGAIVATASVVQGVSCNGVNDGSVDVSASGGSGPLSYLWSNGQTTATISGLLAGNYSVIVSDGSGCADTAYVTLIDPAVLGLTFTTTPESAPGANDGTVTGIVSGGTGPYTYMWLDSLGINVIGTNNPQIGLAAGLYYGVVTDNNGCQFADTVRIDVVNNAVFNITALIEGYYNGAGGLVPALSNSGVAAGPTECDTIYVELRDQISPTTVLASGTAVLSTSGQASFTFPASVIGQNGYIAVFHRNAVQTWSALISFSATTNYDFTTAASQAYNGNQREVAPGVWAFYSGDLSPQDEFIDILDQGVIDNDIFNFVGGYVVSDLSGDGFVDIVDQSIVDNNIFNFIGSSHP